MTQFVFANNVNTALAAPLSSGGTTLTLASSANLPSSIPSGTYLALTLNDAATRLNYEIVYVTAISGATLTVVRAQEGTASLSWATGDFAFSGPTAGQMQSATSGNLLNVQKLTGSGTYTPTPGTNWVILEAVGGGGAGGGAAATTTSSAAAAAGGSAGAYVRVLLTSNFSGQSYSCGAGGTAASAGNNQGGTGGNTTFGSFLTCPGGPGGFGSPASTTPTLGGSNGQGTALPTCTSGTVILSLFGEGGSDGAIYGLTSAAGQGATTLLGIGGWSPTGTGSRSASGYGAGSSGANSFNGSSAQPSVAGAPGVIIIYEYA